MRKNWQEVRSDESGGVAVIMALMLTATLSLAGLVVDLGHLYTVQSEVRKAAEAGAFAGARALRLGADPAALDWANGKNVAANAVQQNFADNRSFADFSLANVQAGYWDMSWDARTSHDLLSSAITPATGQVAAVKVTITKREGGSGSSAPIATYFAGIMRINSMGSQSSAVAILPTPYTIPPGGGFPLVTPLSFARQYFDSDPPHVFRIGDSYHNPDGGQWTSFDVDQNNVPYIRKLIDNGNPNALSIGDDIWVEPGVKDTLYGYAAERIGQTVMLPVVSENFDTHAWTPIVNFVAFQITDTHQGNDPYIEGHFVRNFTISNASGGGGLYLGTSLPPKLVQ